MCFGFFFFVFWKYCYHLLNYKHTLQINGTSWRLNVFYTPLTTEQILIKPKWFRLIQPLRELCPVKDVGILSSTTGETSQWFLCSRLKSDQRVLQLLRSSEVQRCQPSWISLMVQAIYACNRWWRGYLLLPRCFQGLILGARCK